jgi:hypothetical protein
MNWLRRRRHDARGKVGRRELPRSARSERQRSRVVVVAVVLRSIVMAGTRHRERTSCNGPG